MSAPPAGRPIEFRSASIGTTVAQLRLSDPPQLADALHKLLGGMPDFFNGDATILDFAGLPASSRPIDWPGLVSLFRRFQLQPIGVRNLHEVQLAGARKAGLAILDRIELHDTPPPPAPAPVAAPQPAPAPPPVAAPPASAAGTSTLFVERPLRSGQQVYARGGDVVLLAGMSNGAEVIADGSVHCYGPLRGRAIAGATGNTSARIVTTNFGPEIVSIAGVYKTFENGVDPAVAGQAAHVRLCPDAQQQRLTVEALRLD